MGQKSKPWHNKTTKKRGGEYNDKHSDSIGAPVNTSAYKTKKPAFQSEHKNYTPDTQQPKPQQATQPKPQQPDLRLVNAATPVCGNSFPRNTRLPFLTEIDLGLNPANNFHFPLESAQVKFYGGSEKLWGFATTEMPNDSGRPDLFFHLHGGCRVYKHGIKLHMEFIGKNDEVKLREPQTGDLIYIIRGMGEKGEKIVKWCYAADVDNPPYYRLVRKNIKPFSQTVTDTLVLWAGSDLAELRDKFPRNDKTLGYSKRIRIGIEQTSSGSVRTMWEVMVMQSDGEESWQQCGDPR